MFNFSDVFIGFVAVIIMLAVYIFFGEERQKTLYEVVDDYAVGNNALLLKKLAQSIEKFNQPPRIVLEKACRRLANLNVAFMVIDFQNDFVSGSLKIGDGDAKEDPMNVVPVINDLSAVQHFHSIVFTKDWHPADHISFLENARNADRELSKEDQSRDLQYFDKVHFVKPKRDQILYPVHCVSSTWGAEIIDEINIPERAIVVNKGTESLVDSYSAFMDNEKQNRNPLYETLKSLNVDAIVGCGLAYDICVAHTLRDSQHLGFYTAAVKDASAALLVSGLRATEESFECEGIAIMSPMDVKAMVVEKKKFPIEWVIRAVDELSM